LYSQRQNIQTRLSRLLPLFWRFFSQHLTKNLWLSVSECCECVRKKSKNIIANYSIIFINFSYKISGIFWNVTFLFLFNTILLFLATFQHWVSHIFSKKKYDPFKPNAFLDQRLNYAAVGEQEMIVKKC
jgi:hypothetical protein